MEVDPSTLVNAGGLALFALAVLWEIRKLGPLFTRITETLTKLEERSRAQEERTRVQESALGELYERLARRRLVTPPTGAHVIPRPQRDTRED